MSFSHLDAGTPEALWVRDERLAATPPLDLAGLRALVVLAAHPDDETLGAGGLIAHAARSGAAVHVVVATDGEASHPDSPTFSPELLAEIRRGEVRAAVGALAPSATLRCLGLPDGALADHGPALERALGEAVRDALGEEAAGGDWAGVVLAAPWRHDAHTDHDAAGAVAARVAGEAGVALLEYPVWMWHWAAPGSPQVPWAEARRLELAPAVRSAKERALALHVSQTSPLSEHSGDEALLSPGMQEHFERGFELYFASPPRDAGATFDAVHAASPDPWNFTTSWYERRKRAVTLAALPAARYRRALEVGCSIGVLTGELAERADEVVATDVSPRALERAAERLPHAAAISWEHRRLPQEWPEGAFDLIVASEVGYYFGPAELDEFVRRCLGSLTDDGALVACHWLGAIDGWQLTGEDVHARLRAEAGLETVVHHRERDFLLEVFAKPPAASVAQREGLA
ncbi:LmbE family N-acetylglucosaminyl deacetylase [Sinomonas atrocyanea]|nr:LmbE family N-acetylglucosaminyl deacetylase [Sinomonas atrocyanea]